MTQYLSHISISNFRSCRSFQASFAEYTPLVGYNNAGKSNVLAAVLWLLRPASLGDNDFLDRSTPVVVEGIVAAIDETVLHRMQPKHRAKLEPYVADEKLRVRQTQEKPNTGKRGIVLEIYDAVAGEWKPNPSGISQAIQTLFPDPIEIAAMQDAAEDVAKYRTSTTIGKLIAAVMQPVIQEHSDTVSQSLEDLRERFAVSGTRRVAEFEDLDTDATTLIQDFFPDIHVKLHVPTPELGDLLKSGTIRVFEDDLIDRDVSMLGHGAQRSIQMGLIRYLASLSTDRDPSPQRTLLLIDEPELFLHPQGVEQVRDALKKLSHDGFQVLFSTHSAAMIGRDDLPNTLLVRKSKTLGTHTHNRLGDAVGEVIDDAQHQAEVLFRLGNANQILFSEKVLLVEGVTEERVIPPLVESLTNRTLALHKIALVALDGSRNVKKALNILRCMKIPTVAVVDLDFVFTCGVQDEFLEDSHPALCACKTRIHELAEEHEFELNSENLPKNGGRWRAEEAYALLGADTTAAPHIEALHREMLEQDVWVWRGGSIEVPLGIKKQARERDRLISQVIRNGVSSAVRDPDEVGRFVEWLSGSALTPRNV